MWRYGGKMLKNNMITWYCFEINYVVEFQNNYGIMMIKDAFSIAKIMKFNSSFKGSNQNHLCASGNLSP